MSYKCKLVDVNDIYGENKIRNPESGDIWYAPWIKEYPEACDLSDTYLKEYQNKRSVLYICLPNKIVFSPDMKPNKNRNDYIVSGEVPNITIIPSIYIEGLDGYHGWLENGVLSDDMEGRKY